MLAVAAACSPCCPWVRGTSCGASPSISSGSASATYLQRLGTSEHCFADHIEYSLSGAATLALHLSSTCWHNSFHSCDGHCHEKSQVHKAVSTHSGTLQTDMPHLEDRQSDMHKLKTQTDRQTDRETDRQTDRQTEAAHSSTQQQAYPNSLGLRLSTL